MRAVVPIVTAVLCARPDPGGRRRLSRRERPAGLEDGHGHRSGGVDRPPRRSRASQGGEARERRHRGGGAERVGALEPPPGDGSCTPTSPGTGSWSRTRPGAWSRKVGRGVWDPDWCRTGAGSSRTTRTGCSSESGWTGPWCGGSLSPTRWTRPSGRAGRRPVTGSRSTSPCPTRSTSPGCGRTGRSRAAHRGAGSRPGRRTAAGSRSRGRPTCTRCAPTGGGAARAAVARAGDRHPRALVVAGRAADRDRDGPVRERAAAAVPDPDGAGGGREADDPPAVAVDHPRPRLRRRR